MGDYMRSNVKFFLEEHKELLRENRFKELYLDAIEEIPYQVGNMTAAFMQAGINPLLYVDKVLPLMFSNSMIKEIVIPDNIRAINSNAFRDCFELKQITIPKSVKGIHIAAFKGCYELSHIFYQGTTVDWNAMYVEPSTFWDCAVGVVDCIDGEVLLPEA